MQAQKYLSLLSQLKISKYKNSSQSLCCFNAQKGNEYNNNLMIVGRAVNGWHHEFDMNNLNVETMVNEIFNQAATSDCPLKWVEDSWGINEGYNTKSSAFWRVTKQVSQCLNENSSSTGWASKIVWSNLYKIAPSITGNPSDSLCDKQFVYCNELLLAEIEEYNPRVIIFFTGLNWFNGFLSNAVSLASNKEHSLVEAHGVLKINDEEVIIIIAKHPQGKPEAEMVNEILSITSVT
ncbi:uracil-DNA glycosylase family protein [Shewanella sp. MF05960]|uniref:uracil-DNA glycosylase family protein n=1 Tax=Shewanella sp. MF05960 TaxID=3434874 RepID=UPI003D7B03C2